MAADSSKEEEIDGNFVFFITWKSLLSFILNRLFAQLALCLSINVKPSASDVEKLRAIDQEYHFLIESKQNAKAEHVQQLYHFKAQKINSVSFFMIPYLLLTLILKIEIDIF